MMVHCPLLAALPSVRHGFFTRRGGVSNGIYASLNCGFGSGDVMADVAENRARATAALGQGAHALCSVYQMHSTEVVTVDALLPWQEAPRADAMVTNYPGCVLGILTADCLPVLFADSTKPIIAAAHAGWKGAFCGILEAVVEKMAQLGSDPCDIVATIGPGIAQGSYEVGADFHARFLQQAPENQLYFIHGARAGHYLFDLKAYAKDRLRNSGVGRINVLAHDTCLEESDFFSYRRATLRGEHAYGRQLSAILLEM